MLQIIQSNPLPSPPHIFFFLFSCGQIANFDYRPIQASDVYRPTEMPPHLLTKHVLTARDPCIWNLCCQLHIVSFVAETNTNVFPEGDLIFKFDLYLLQNPLFLAFAGRHLTASKLRFRSRVQCIEHFPFRRSSRDFLMR